MEKEYKGYNGTIIITDRGVTIKRGVKGFLLCGFALRGDKTIPFSSIVAVQLKKAGILAGYIQFTLAGGTEAKGGLFQSGLDENSINFYKDSNDKFEECRRVVEERMGSVSGKQVSSADEISKFAELAKNGVITQEEFNQKKKQLLSL